jgi:hypothetical protein
MAEPMLSPDDRELDRALADLAGQLAYPPTPDLAGRVRRRLQTQPARPRRSITLWRLAVAALVLIAVAGTAVALSPAVQTAIAERLGLRGIQIQHVPSLPAPDAAPPGSRLSLGQPMTLAQVRERVAYPVVVPSALGAPDEVYLLDPPPGGQVALVYDPRPDLPPAGSTGVGLLLTEFLGNVHATGVVGKGLPAGTSLEAVQVNNSPGYWITGDPHSFFYLDVRGQARTETTRLAGSVLLWEQRDVTFRLEAALAKDAALEIAASVPQAE